MCFYIILQLYLENMAHLLLQLRIQHREDDLHTAVQVSRHPVSTSHIVFLIAVVIKIENTAMLQKITNDRAHTDVFTHTGDTDPQTADSPHDQVNLYPGSRCLIQSSDDVAVT